ncbi:MAG: hypothetical protein JWN26_142 [Candidatus Saccharibacteria bacterium]|nr:hypothetical protein [Candidatus Saccharibacteria bacterium]
MAQYKVPQDVEADDKLIGPFSFRQFVYLIIVALSGAAAWALYQLFPLLIIIPLPIIVFFGALALPLRKDQPMEVYLAAMVSFYLKPHRRLWDPDGIDSLIEITVPKVVEIQRTKDISQGDAQQRFGYLAEIVDSQGWAIRGQTNGTVQAPNSAMNTEAYYSAQQAEDILDSNYGVAQSLDYMISQTDNRRRQEMMDRMRAIPEEPAIVPEPATTTAVAAPTATSSPVVTPAPAAAPQTPAQSGVKPAPNPFNFFASQPSLTTDSNNPYPPNMQQKVIQPLDPTNTSGKVVSADIMNLANDAQLSIETIAHEANRINQRDGTSGEVIVSLR